MPVTGIHHVTAIAGPPQRSLDFYTRILGLRLVKRTVNFDAPDAYHLYYGDAAGSPGTALTFFHWADDSGRGSAGAGMATGFDFSVPVASLPAWSTRLASHGIQATPVNGAEHRLRFNDPDGFRIDLVGSPDPRAGWTARGVDVPKEETIRGFFGATLAVGDLAASAHHFEKVLGFRRVETLARRIRLEAGAGGPGTYLDLDETSTRGRTGTGAVHHVAFRVPDDAAQEAMLRTLADAGFHAGPVRDRTYFRSIYWREPSGVICEIATDIPGFSTDESLDELGSSLKLPPQYERLRSKIEQALPPLVTEMR